MGTATTGGVEGLGDKLGDKDIEREALKLGLRLKEILGEGLMDKDVETEGLGD